MGDEIEKVMLGAKKCPECGGKLIVDDYVRTSYPAMYSAQCENCQTKFDAQQSPLFGPVKDMTLTKTLS